MAPIQKNRFASAWMALCVLVATLCASFSVKADSVVVFNEIHYHPRDPQGTEWIELHNQMAIDVDLSHWRLRGGVDYDFPSGTVIPADGYLLIASNPDQGVRGALGPWSGQLANDGEELRLRNNSGRLMDRVEYGDRGRWPIGPDGSGATLAKTDEDTASGHPANWRASAEVGGTPAARNFPNEGEVGPAIVIVPMGASWRYNESGVQLPSGWAGSAHPVGVNGWQAGLALFGFETAPEQLPEAIETAFADTTQNDIVSYYFETEFDLSADQIARIEELSMRHIIDDGAVFYLNGTEVGQRFNMAPGLVEPGTLSNGTVGNAENKGPFPLPVGALTPGFNRLSVEVHQRAADSSDIVFGAELSMTLRPVDSGGAGDRPLLISELAGTNEQIFRLELANRSGEDVAAGGMVVASHGVVEASYTIPPEVIVPDGSFLVLDETTLGFRPKNGDRLVLYTPGEAELRHAVRADDMPRAWSVEHERMLVPDEATFGEENSFAINSDVVINEIMYHFREDPGVEAGEPIVERTELISRAAIWRYNESGAALPANWAESTHQVNGVDWLSGPGLLGFEFGSLPEPIRTQLKDPFLSPIITHYFEREFELTAEQLAGSLRLELSHIIDDGALIYLNGEEVERYKMPQGAVNSTTPAIAPIRNADLVGPVLLPTGSLVVGTNRISVEVHQDKPNNGDVVFGLSLEAVVELAGPTESQPIVERDEEWVELHNKGLHEVNLTGWSIDGGIDFDFPADTRIPSGGYLVVAKDVAALLAKYPSLAGRVVGDYRNRLNNDRDLIRLEDARENPVDEVEYVEGGRWPGLADGRGSSLELRDPEADNANPQAWAASDESSEQGWQTIRYRGNGSQSYGLTVWNEFRLGMLQAGEVLIDDVSVVRDPDGTAEELIQNGGFNRGSGTWRMLGNHRHSQVVAEPGNPGNQVLHLMATGATDTRHNHLETTFLNNRSLSSGQIYEVSFRARWLAGSNQLNSRCYYQRLARTTQLDRPEHCGTPGRVNSQFEDDIGPTFAKLRHDPPVPGVNEEIRITAAVAHPVGLGDFVLKARYNEGRVETFNFLVDGSGMGEGFLPGAAAGTVIQFWVEASGNGAPLSMAPQGGPNSRALIQVEDNQGTALPVQELRLIMLPSDRNFLLQNLNLMSNERIGGTAIYNRKKVTYDVGVRLRGSGAGRARDGSTVRSFSIAFPADDLFRGVHGSIGADRSARAPVGRRPDEIYIKHMFNHAGVPCMYDDLVHVIGPSPTYTGIAMLQMARYGALFMESQFENGDKGGVFNLDITYDPVTSHGGVEGPKPPVPFQHIGTDIRDLGDSKEDYRTSFEIRSGRRRDDYAALMEFCQTMSLPTAELDARIESVMDVDEWMRYSALIVLCGIGDTFVSGGLQHNIRMYAPGGSGPVVALPWDNDFVFTAGTTSSMLPMRGNLRRVVDIPRFRRLYWGHVHDLINTSFNPRYMNTWLSHYGSVIGANLRGQGNYMNARGNYARGQLPANVPFEITTNNGNDFSVSGTLATVKGEGWINVRELRLAGTSDPLPLRWLDAETWQVQIPVLPGPNAIALEVYDFQGRLLNTASLTITSTASEPQPVDFLRITELHFNPIGSDGSEFVELKNIGAQPLDLGGVHFADGFSFTVPDNTMLDPGDFALVVRNRSEFEAIYGRDLPVLGQFDPDGLSNRGERIELRDASGNVILDFSYSDAWYPAADGGGYSLVVRDEKAAVGNWNTAEGWALSGSPGGNPNVNNSAFSVQFEGWQREHFTEEELASPAISDPLGDANGDGTANLWNYAAGLDPWAKVPVDFLPAVEVTGDRMRLHVRLRKDAVDLQVAAEFSDDLVSWESVLVPTGAPIDHGDGTQTLTFEDLAPSGAHRFAREHVTLSSP